MTGSPVAWRSALLLVCIAFMAGAAWGAEMSVAPGWHRPDTIITILAPLLVWAAWTGGRRWTITTRAGADADTEPPAA
jgi:hypothetical protein